MKQVKEAYVSFLNHCYVDTEVEMKEIYASNHMWTVFEKSFLPDINRVADQVTAAMNNSGSSQNAINVTRTKAHRQLAKYVCDAVIIVICSFFGSPFSSTAASTPDHHHHHRIQTGADESGSGSPSVVIAATTPTANTNAAAVVQVCIFCKYMSSYYNISIVNSGIYYINIKEYI